MVAQCLGRGPQVFQRLPASLFEIQKPMRRFKRRIGFYC